jgi:amidase
MQYCVGGREWKLICPCPAAALPDLFSASTEDLAHGLQQQRFTSQDLVRAYTARIHEVNGTLAAVTELNPDALEWATVLDRERAEGKLRGPLHGLPILIKNNIATNDHMNNTAGSYALLGSSVPRDAGIVTRLRNAGAIVLGKANLSQWAGFRSSSKWADHKPDNSSNGWSAHGGQVLGAYYPEQDPLGSSSGPAVSASIGLALAAIGTETVGSIIGPAAQSNCVGIKPTVGLTSRDMVVPLSEHQDSPGPIARSVKDAAYLLQAIAGYDAHDNYTTAIPKGAVPDFVAACKAGALKGARIGVPRNLIFPEPPLAEVLAAFEKAIETLKAAGATVVDNTNVTADAAKDNEDGQTQLKVLAADFSTNLPSYMSKLTHNPHGIHSVSDLRHYTRTTPIEAYPDRDTGLWDSTLNSTPATNTGADFAQLYAHNIDLVGRQGITGVMANHSLDALLLPSDFASYFPARLGSPLVTVPMAVYPKNFTAARTNRGLVSAAPGIGMGVSFMGKKWDETRIIGYAFDFEQRTKVRDSVQPYLKPKTGIK